MNTRTKFLLILLTFSLQGFGQANDKSTTEKSNEKSPIYWLYDAHYRLGIQYNDYAEAKSALYNLVLLEPQNDSLRYNLAFMYFDAGQYPSTILVCKDILGHNDSHLGALEITAVSFENLGLKDKALTKYEKLFMVSSSLNALYKMAFLQYDLKKFSESSVNIDMLLEKKELSEAKIVFTDENKKSKEYPMKVAVLNLKGLVNKELGNKEKAKKAFEAALALAPDFVLAKTNLANLTK
jgi:tetratricopeptide (TPR) repeat protein